MAFTTVWVVAPLEPLPLGSVFAGVLEMVFLTQLSRRSSLLFACLIRIARIGEDENGCRGAGTGSQSEVTGRSAVTKRPLVLDNDPIGQNESGV